jgi:hypothetical protein
MHSLLILALSEGKTYFPVNNTVCDIYLLELVNQSTMMDKIKCFTIRPNKKKYLVSVTARLSISDASEFFLM